MDQFPLDQIVHKTGSRFAVVVAAAKRAEQIKDGSPPLVETTAKNPLSIALAEIAEKKVLICPLDADPEDDVPMDFAQYFAGRERRAEETPLSGESDEADEGDDEPDEAEDEKPDAENEEPADEEPADEEPADEEPADEEPAGDEE